MISTKRVRQTPINTFEVLPSSGNTSEDEDLYRGNPLHFPSNSSGITINATKLPVIKAKDAQDVKVIMNSIVKENKLKDEEIKKLRMQLMEDSNIQDNLNNNEDDDEEYRKKVRELSKKLKRLTVAYERERTKNAIISTQLQELESCNNKKQNSSSDIEKSMLTIRAELKMVKEKHAIAIRKIEDERMHNHNLQKEIRNLHKVLVKELGEGYSVEKLLKNDSSIKGRTEQISILKDKIKQLNQKLKQSSFKNMEEVIPKPQSRTKTGPDHNGLHRLELDKRKEYEKVQSELNELNQKLAEMKIKSDGLIARNRILEDTKKETKAQITALLKKADDDDQFIAALREEVSKYKMVNDSNPEFDKLRVKCAEQEQLIIQLRRKDNRSNYSNSRNPSRLSTRDENTDRLLESLQNELQVMRTAKEEFEKNFTKEKNANIQLNSKILFLEEKLKRSKSDKQIIESNQSLLDKYEILKDENEALKISIKTALDEKAADLKIYQQLLDESRQQLDCE